MHWTTALVGCRFGGADQLAGFWAVEIQARCSANDYRVFGQCKGIAGADRLAPKRFLRCMIATGDAVRGHAKHSTTTDHDRSDVAVNGQACGIVLWIELLCFSVVTEDEFLFGRNDRKRAAACFGRA